MQLWANQNLSLQELIDAYAASLAQLNDPALANMPPILRRQLEFPYTDGYAFASQLYQLGGFDAINAALSSAVPASTEQILHPDKYLANEAPVQVDAPDISSSIGAGWSMTYQQTMGELVMQVWAAGSESPPDVIPGQAVAWPHADSVDGWGGDRLNMYEGPDGAWIIDWMTAWDSQTDADKFSARTIDLQPTLQGHMLLEPGAEPKRHRTRVPAFASDLADRWISAPALPR